MKDPKQLQEYAARFNAYSKLIAISQQLGVNSADAVLRSLLYSYADILEPQDSAGNKLKKIFSKLAHSISRNYKHYIITKFKEAAAREGIKLNDFIANIDNDISGSEEQRKQHGITEPHNHLGSFQALWVAFFYKYPDAVNLNQLQAENSIIHGCLKEAETLPAVFAMERGVPRDVWKMIGAYSGSSVINLALADTRRHRFLKDSTTNAIQQRRQFLQHVEDWELEQVSAMLKVDSSLVIEPWYNAERDVIRIACLDQNKEMYDLLVSYLPQIDDPDEVAFQAQLNEFHYLVRGGQRGRAEQFLEQFDLATRERLIFGRNYQGFSAVELTALEKDVEMRMRFERELSPNPKELKEAQGLFYEARFHQDEKSWDAYLELLMKGLDDKYKSRFAEHINNIQENQVLTEQAANIFNKYQSNYKKVIQHYKSKGRYAGEKIWVEVISKLRRKLARWCSLALLSPDNLYYENFDEEKSRPSDTLEDTLEFTLNGIFPCLLLIRERNPITECREVDEAIADLDAITRTIEVNQQKSMKESRALQPPALAHGMKR